MRLLTLLAGYAAGLAVAMKYRKDAGTSKLDPEPNKSKMDAFIDEVVDIHKSAYSDVKGFVSLNFSDVKDLPSLKAKVTSFVDAAMTEAQELIESFQNKWIAQKEDLEGKVDEFFEQKSAILEETKAKGIELTDATSETVESWIDEAKTRLFQFRDTLKNKIASVPTDKAAPAPATKSRSRKVPPSV